MNTPQSMDNADHITPKQETGSSTHTSHSVIKLSPQEAQHLFAIARYRLQDINNWDKLCGHPSSEFTLTDGDGNKVNRLVQKGDHIRINIPGPGTKTGEGYDWVRVEEIQDEQDIHAIRVRPAPDPLTPSPDTAHFFHDTATSTFFVERHENAVTSSVQGRNEKPNQHTEHIVDKIRNTFIAVGAVLGFSNPQWKKLVKGLLEE